MGKKLLGITAVLALLGAVCIMFAFVISALKDDGITAVFAVGPQPTQPQETDVLHFPFIVEGTTLIANSLAMYEGDMIENETERFLVDAAALEVYNFGTEEIELAEVKLKFDQDELVFFGTNIPAGGRVLIIEQSGKGWTQEPCGACYGWVQYTEEPPLPDGVLLLQDVDMGTVAVTNTTEKTLNDIWLFYKHYLYEDALYLGGITYIEVIPWIRPGQTLQIKPEYYASGYSKFIKAKQVQ